MSSDIQFETFLLVSYKKFSILVIKTSDLQKIYQEEIQFSNDSNQIIKQSNLKCDSCQVTVKVI